MKKRLLMLVICISLVFAMGTVAFAADDETLADQLLASESVEEMYTLMLEWMDKDIDALLNLTSDEINQIRDRVAELDPEGDDIDTVDLLDTLDLLPNGGEVGSAYELIAVATSLKEMLDLLTAEENAEGVAAMTANEIDALFEKTYNLYNALSDEPIDADAYYYEDVLKKLDLLLCGGVATYATRTYNWPADIGTSGYTVKSGDIWDVTLTGDLTLTKIITVNGTLNINTDGNGEHKLTRAKGSYFVINGGTLTINGNAVSPITVNGGSSAAAAICVGNNGNLKLNYVNIKNYTNTSSSGNGCRGGAIRFGAVSVSNGAPSHAETSATASGTISNVTIDGCQAANGSAIMLIQNCTGTVTVSNSTIKNCRSNFTDWGGTIRTQGKYNGKLIIESCLIENNYSSKNGGGVYWNACGTNAALTIKGTADKPTIIRGNSAGTQGGGLHLGGQEITIEHTHILGNSAPNGGGISMTPYDDGSTTSAGCSVTLGENAKLEGNSATNQGGGIYMRIYSADPANGVTFSVNVNNGAVIKDNNAANGGAFAILQETGTKKYHANVNINGGTIFGNEASQNGGAFYISRNYKTTESSYKLDVKVAGGSIYDNSAAGNGGAIYLSDTASSAKVTVSGGTIGATEKTQGNSAVNGGAVYITGGNFTMSGGTVSNNSATTNGGAVYVSGGNYTMTAGTVTENSAQNGGAAYVSGGVYNLNGGTITENNATVNGGAVYVNNGKVNMTDGTLTANLAANYGGAVYITGGDFEMTGGSASANTATRGGAVYVDGGNFNMISGKLLSNGTSETYSKVTEYGGAVYVNGGDITVGVNGCSGGAEGTKHTVTHTDKIHPIIKENKAQYGGAFAVRGENDANGNATSGKVNVYCSYIINNKGDNQGTGHNIYMDGGSVCHYVNSAKIGEDTNHDIVSVGGQLKVVDQNGNAVEIKMIYDSNAHSINMQWTGTAPEGYYLNLPYCPKDWEDEQAKPANGSKAFVGWTEVPSDSTVASSVRDTDDYDPIGSPIEIDGGDDNQMIFYAVWAPLYNNISYAYTIDGINVVKVNGASDIGINAVGADNFSQYTYSHVSYERNIPDASRAGYNFAGWLMYADTNKISNWNADPLNNKKSNDVSLIEDIPQPAEPIWKNKIDRNFGDITLVAIFEPANGDLKISKTLVDTLIADPNQAFIFQITGDPDDKRLDEINMTVVLYGNDEVIINDLPVGDYTVTEQTDWSWKYLPVGDSAIAVDLAAGEVNSAVFSNEYGNPKWLSFDNVKVNEFRN